MISHNRPAYTKPSVGSGRVTGRPVNLPFRTASLVIILVYTPREAACILYFFGKNQQSSKGAYYQNPRRKKTVFSRHPEKRGVAPERRLLW